MEFEAKLTGFNELEKLLKDLPDKPARRVIESGVKAAANIIKKDATRRVPVRSGRLKASIQVKKDTRAFRRGFVQFKVGANVSPRRGTVAPHAHLVEFGSKPRVIKVDKKSVLANPETSVYGTKVQHPGNKPQPFLRPAFDENQGKIIIKMRDMMGKSLAREAEKLAGIYKTNKKR